MAKSKFKVGMPVIIRGKIIIDDNGFPYPIVVRPNNSNMNIAFTKEGKNFPTDKKPCLEIDKEAGHEI